MSYVFDNPHAYRGFFISKFANLEFALNCALAFRFVKIGDGDDIIHVLIDRLTFEAKRSAYRGLLERYSKSKGFVKTKNNKWPYGELLDELRQLNEIRVQFAHYLLADEDIDKEYVIALIEFRDSSGVWKFSQEYFDSIIERVDNAYFAISNTFDLMREFI